MKKIAFVVQRYGLEVNGGAEYLCRALAEKLSSLYEVEILTSCAKNYFTWANEYNEGVTIINGVKVRRFSTPQEKNKSKVHRLVRKLQSRTFSQRIASLLGIQDRTDFEQTSYEWSKQQGPFTPGLISYLENNHKEYDALIFFTYLYFPTLYGLKAAAERSILIPTAHDEEAIYLPVYKSFFKLPKAILYLTLSEKRLVNRLFSNEDIYSDIVGAGIEKEIAERKLSAADILKSDQPYLIYIGRIDPDKGGEILFQNFLKYKEATGSPVKLVLVGTPFMEIPKHEDIISMGFVDDAVKQALLYDAKALVMPSLYESLSLVTLEGMLAGVPVIANRDCEVLKDHIENSQAGFTFNDFKSFKSAVDEILNDGFDLGTLQQNGKKYIDDNYSWEAVISKMNRAIDFVSK
ncbi:glycosyltransferase involved in cell wall biosynthesis [Pedobacter cryoconitis]|uniref:glycosyltransferase family 4 protein n=1 Tax=Pedobacter cryoconitis TaxID=188932 RepID=UPI00161D6506|nr:glycosyltransferase family 4 protein [Pedobacter cryoconitis]MBB6273474.1 glycosyltransferase involved in cell wall biosynthesis [Pedobacter cryoconitis]